MNAQPVAKAIDRSHSTSTHHFWSIYVLLCKAEKGESVEQFYGTLKEIAEIRNFENRQDDDIQCYLLPDTVELQGGRGIAVNMKMGQQN